MSENLNSTNPGQNGPTFLPSKILDPLLPRPGVTRDDMGGVTRDDMGWAL